MSPVVAPQIPEAAITDLTGKKAVVTGGTKGIGLAIVQRFVDAGATVVASGRDEPTALPTGVQFVGAELSTLEGVHDLARQAQHHLGDIDIVVNNAGATTPHPDGVLDIEDAEWQGDLSLNFLAAVRLNAALLPGLYERGRGAIVNISSVAVSGPAPMVLHYAAAKSALSTYTRGLAAEAGPRGVRVNGVSPGYVVTPASKRLTALYGVPPGESFPLQRLGDPRDIAEAVAFLASDRTPWITGIDIPVAGGSQ